MAKTAVVVAELQDLAKAFLLARSAFNRAYCQFLQDEVTPCPDQTGWLLLEAFRDTVGTYCLQYKRGGEGIKQAAWEIFRLELVGDADYSYPDLVGFVKWYGKLKGKIDQAIAHLYEFHGDSFGDLVDSYPLAGRVLVDRALATHPQSDRPRRDGYLDEGEVRGAVREKLGLPWHKLICEGENYVARALEDASHRCFLRRVLSGRDSRVAWTEAERAAVTFADHYSD
jgi:hypothetical protein